MKLGKGKKETVEKSQKKSLKSKTLGSNKLSTKLGVICGIVLFICMMGSNLLSISRFTNGLNTTMNAQFNKISEENVLKIQTVLDQCTQISDAVNFEMQHQFALQAGGIEEATYSSKVTDKLLTKEQQEAEEIILNTIWSAIDSNDVLEGVGVFFEPYTFSPNIEHYGPYAVRTDVATRTFENFTYDRYETRPY
ncbi:MAG: hypothetical protein IKI92_04955 [Anaerotignum sp.]|nr:hypothetical protein [Anaerotignum sp.]